VLVNVALALTLFPTLGETGIATAESTAGWVNAALLFATLAWRGHWGNDLPLLTRLPRLVFAAAVMGVTLWFALGWLEAHLEPSQPLLTQAIVLAGLIAMSMVIYFGVAFATGGANIGMIRRNVKRGRGSAAAPPDGE